MHVGQFFRLGLSSTKSASYPVKLKLTHILESTNTVQILSDSRPCVQAYDRLCQGQFSLSASVSTFLSTLSCYKVSLQHISGVANLPADYHS